ncbi:SNF2-related protein [Streptomyces sp. NPDC058084]|uniref:SNF2-related protein n=1 Tax=Streptomyces sp. NPDC058084 TaxID=3346333 RepID=UPI0036EC9140
MRSVWGAVRNLGFRGGRVLEPGSGSGNFIGFSPILLRDPVQMTGVEVEPVTAQIARHLYPDAEIVTSGLEEIELADGGFDAVVGNVPYGRYARFDKVHNKDLALSIHDHFVLKSLYATRPGGVVALITSRYTMDAVDPGARTRMYELGDLVGAVRLPARAHATAAGTDVVTDVLFLRRRMPGEEPGDDTWLTSTKRQLPGHDDELAVNTYFDAHPEYVLGELRAGSREWGPEVTVVGRTDQTPAQALASAAASITVEARAAGLTAADDQRTEPVPTIVTSGTEGALGLDGEGNPTIIDGGRPVPLEVHPDQREQLLQLIRLKGLTLDLYELEAATDEPGETPDLARLRAELRVAWRDYRKSHPPLTKPRQHFKFTPAEARAQATAQGLKDVPEAWKHRTAFAWIDDDPDASLLFGLEEWDDRSGKGIEQKVLRARVLEPRILPARANSHEDAVALAMEYDGGRLDMSRVASLLGLDEESAATQIADAGLAYRDPQQSDAWEPGHRYLSGNVRTKLAAARERAAEDPTFQGNVAALERVQPSDLAPSEIKAKIGAPWVPVDVYNDFLAHLGFEDASVVHAGGTVWEVRGAKNGDLARTEWGTGSRPTQDLFTALLRQTESTIQVTWRDKDGHTFVDKEATDAAQEKAKLIAEAFEDWVWDDETRAARLAKIYNHQFNNLVLPEYSPAALTLPGLISDWTMKEHQNAAIRRIVNEPTALLAHVVGAGKTATMAAGAMELRRTGLAKKPCLIVPNHMLKQWSREFRQLYPNAKILAITASDLGKKRRAKFMGRIAGGEWDAVILTHEAFTRVPLRPDTQRSYLDREMRSLREQLDAAAEAGMARNTVKQIEESLANAEAKLQQQIDSMDDEVGVFLEDTGIDYVFLDEAHEFKNLRTVSAIPGAAIQGSARATKLHMVLDYLRETNESERVATLATGTPIANSVTEAYVLKRYLAPQLLEEMGLDAFDNWAATFGEVVSNLEPDPKGDGYKYKARFSRFFNVPELMSGYRTFADVQMAEDLNLPTPPVRENEDGQRGEYVLIPPTPAQRQFIKELPHKPWVRKPGGVLKALGEGLRASVDLDLVDATEALRNLGLNVTADQVMSDDPAGGGRVLDLEKVAELADAAATDMRSLGGTKEMGSKIPYAAEKIAEIWQETKDIVYPVSGDDPTPQDLPGGLQLVFLDEGTPGSTAKHAANLYQDLRDELVARGMPRESIRFIHEAGTDRKKEKLFADCRAGRVRVLVGSTQKMGTGTNIQDRSVALHHLSYPWRPADMAQRDGRIERRGNLNVPWIDHTPDDVRILYYITERTFDEFRLTTLARKARFIGQIQRRDFSAREIEDIGADAINLGMLSALASGDPAILQLAEATAERARLQGLARSWDRQQDTRSQQLTDIDDFLARADTALEGMRAAAPNRRPTTGDAFAMTVDDATYRSRDTAANALGARMAAIAADQSIRPGEHVPLGTFGNQDFHAEIAFGASGRRQLRLRFAWGNVVPIGHREDRAQWQASSVTPSNGRGAIQSLEHFLNNLDADLEKLDASVTSSRARREEIAGNLRPKDENPYRIQARSKEREERALGKLVVANEKEAALAERVERAASVNEDAAEEVTEELTALREHIASLRQSIADEHEIQARAQGLVQPETAADDQDETPTPEDTPATEAAPAGEPTQTAGPTVAADRQQDTPPTEPQDPNQAPEDAPPAETAPAGEATQTAEPPAAADPSAEQQDANPEPPEPAADSEEPPAPERSREQQFQEAVDELFRNGEAPAGTGEPDTPETTPEPTEEERVRALQRQSMTLNDWWLTSSEVDVPEGHQPFSDATVDLVAGDLVRVGKRQYMEDRHLQYHTVTVESGPDPRDGYYLCTNADGIRRRFHPREIVAVPDGSRLLAGNAPAPEQTEAPEPTQNQETTAQDPQEHTGPSPEWARIAAVLRYYEPLLQRHKLSGRETVAFLDRPGAGYRYEPGNPLSDLMADIAKAGERAGGSYRISYNEWVNYEVGERRQQQSDTLINLSIDLMTLHSGQTEPLFLVDLEAILAAPPGTVVELPTEAELAADDAAAARIVISHDAEGTDVRNTPPGGPQGIRDALNDLGFKWSRRQQKWYLRRDTPFEDRDTAVRGLRAAFEKLGVPYTYNSPEQAPEGGQEASEDSQQQTAGTAAPDAPPPATTPSTTPAPGTGQDREPDAPAPDTNDPDERQTQPDADGTEQPAPPAATPGEDAPAPDGDPEPPEETEETSAEPETAPAQIVQTPDGPGTVLGSDGDLILVSTASGTRVWEASDVQWPDGTARPENTDQTARKRQNAADTEQAATAEGIELRFGDGNRLVDLDTEAGHGTVVDPEGTVIGWVRARTGDDGRRYWWGQDARGGAPDSSPFHEELPPSAGVPAIRAAGRVRTHMVRATEPEHRHPTTVEYAAREVRLTTAQVRELRQLTLTATYSDGSAIEPPEWVGAHRRYFLNVAQIRALGEAAQAAATALSGTTAEERRTARVLRNAAERFAFEAYDTARWRATIPPIGETDPYAGPYQPQPQTDEAAQQPVPVSAAARSTTATDDDNQAVMFVVDDEFSILYAAYRALLPAGSATDITQDTGRIPIGDGSAHADAVTVERLLAESLLEHGTNAALGITDTGRQRLSELERAGRAEPAVGDRVLLVGSGRLGIVSGYTSTQNGTRIADVVCDLEGWPNGWDTNVGALFMTTVEPAALDPAAAIERYRVAALRQFPGTLTDPTLRANALEALTDAALADPKVAQAAHANDPNNFVAALAARTREWMTDRWENTEPERWPEWVRAYFRQGDQAVDQRNGLYSELAGQIYQQLRAPESDPALVPTPAVPASTEREASDASPAGQAEPDLEAAARDVRPAPHWRIVGAESDEQAAVRFGGNELLRAFAARAQVVPAPSALTDTSADVWMDGRMVGRIIDVNDAADFTGPGGAPLWSAELVFGTSDERLARFRSRDAALAELAVRALRTGPPALDRLDDDMVASFTRYLTQPLPGATSDDAVSTARLAELTAVLDALAQGRSLGASIAEDLVLAHDSLLWLAATQPDVQVRDDLETRADTIRGYLNVFRPGDPRAAQNWATNQTSDTAPAPAPPADPALEQAEDGEEGQLDLFPAETPDTPAPPRPARRRGGRGKEPAIPPRTEGGPEDGRTGVYGHADHGECERCGTPDTSRYTVVWQWHSSDHGAMAAECASCVELTLGLPYPEIARLADLAEVRRGGERIQPRPHPEGFDVVTRRTADNEFTTVHLPTGKRYRQAKESPSGYRGYVTRDLYGISHGTTVGLSDSVARRAALGHTAETHPNNSDSWVLFSYGQDLKQVLLHDGETIVRRGNNPRFNGVFEHGPRWDMTVSGTAYVVEMVYQSGPPGDDGHRLEVTAPDQSSTRHVHWDGALEWAREHARTTGTAPANVPAEELTTAEETTPLDATAAPAQPELDLDLGTTGPDDEDDPEYEVAVPGEEPAATATPDPIETPAPAPEAEEGLPTDDEVDAAPERVRGPMLTLGLREGPEGQVVARVEAGEAMHTLVLPGIVAEDFPGQSLPVTVEVPMLARAAQLAEQLVSDDETAAWLGEHLPNGALAAAWSSDRVRAVLIVVVRDSLRDNTAPSVDDVAAWLVNAAVENDGLLRAAHTAAGPEDFATSFAVAADDLIADGGSEHLLWTYLGGEGTRRPEVLALATPDAYAQLLALPAPDDVQTAEPTAPTAPAQDPPEEPEMATPARPEEPARGYVVPPAPPAPEPVPTRGYVVPPAPPAPEPVPARGYVVPPAPPAPEPVPAPAPDVQQETAGDVDVQDPPEPQTFTTSAPLAAYPQHQVHLEGRDGTGYSRGELHREGQRIATLQRTVGGQWYARMELDPADITRLVDTPEVAAENGAVMYAAFTGVPLGDPVVAAPGADIQARAEQVRSELREFAAQHRQSIEIAARQLLLNFAQNPQYEELVNRLEDVADSDGRGARMMAADLAGVERAVNAWGGTLPLSPNSEVRAALAFPLAHMLFDVRRLQARLQATVEVAEAERARQRAAAEPTPPAPEAAEEGGPVEEAPHAAPEPSAAADGGTEQPTVAEDEPPTSEAAATTEAPAAPAGKEGEPDSTAEEQPAAAEDIVQAPAAEPTDRFQVTLPAAPSEDPALAAPEGEEEAASAPLWGTDEVPVVAYAAGEGDHEQGAAAADADDVLANFQGFREAWDDAVTSGVTSTELFDDVRADLTTLQSLFTEAVNGPPVPEADVPPAGPDTAPERDEPREAEAVNATLREADARAESLQELPEWQKIQTVRGAMGHLLTTIRKRAGDQFDKLLGDKRASGFLRELSARACDKIAELAQAAARKLRGENGRADERGGPLPSAEVLLRLGDATTAFSAPRRGSGGTPPSTGGATDRPDIPAMRAMGEALAKPMPGARPKVSAAAARGKSTTAKRSPVKKPGTDKTTEQASHLRRGPDKPQPRKPQR